MIDDRSDLASLAPRLRPRRWRIGAGVLCGAGFLPQPASAAGARDPRLIVIILRGALDGLSAVPPVGDPDYARCTASSPSPRSGERAALPLDGFFAAPSLARRLQAHVRRASTRRSSMRLRPATAIVRISTARTCSKAAIRARAAPTAAGSTGLWARCRRRRGRRCAGSASARPRRSSSAARRPRSAGRRQAASRRPADDLTQRVLDLYAQRDPCSASDCSDGLAAEKVASEEPATERRKSRRRRPGRADAPAPPRAPRGSWPTPDGPRIAALAFDGFDTHQNEGAAQGRSPSASRGSTPRSTLSRRTLATPGRTRSSSPSPNSAAPSASTAPTAPTTARLRWRCWRAERSPEDG